MGYLKSFPPKFRSNSRTFRCIARYWFVDQIHPDNCRCDGCFSGPQQMELFL
jgi:hypothetical protein